MWHGRPRVTCGHATKVKLDSHSCSPVRYKRIGCPRLGKFHSAKYLDRQTFWYDGDSDVLRMVSTFQRYASCTMVTILHLPTGGMSSSLHVRRDGTPGHSHCGQWGRVRATRRQDQRSSRTSASWEGIVIATRRGGVGVRERDWL